MCITTYVFCWIFEQKSVVFLYTIKLLFLLTEADCVHCTVRADSSNMNHVKFLLQSVTNRKNHRYFSCLVCNIQLNTDILQTQFEGHHKTQGCFQHSIFHISAYPRIFHTLVNTHYKMYGCPIRYVLTKLINL